MAGARIGIVTLGLPGHVHPTLPIVRELARSGHTVSYFSTRRFRELVERAGAAFTILPSRAEDPSLPLPPALSECAQVPLLAEAVTMLPPLLEALARAPVDVLVYDFMALAGRFAARRARIPAVQVYSTQALNAPVLEALARLEAVPAGLREATRDRWRSALPSLAALGIHADRDESLVGFEERRNVALIPPSFQTLLGTLPAPAYRFSGPCLWLDRDEASSDPVDPVEPGSVFISMGTVFGPGEPLARSLVEACGRLPRRVIWASREAPPAGRSGLPDNLRIYPHVAQLRVLERAAVFVTHGGMNGLLEAVFHRVPVLLVPQTGEQALNAARAESLGIGRRLSPAELAPGPLAAALEEVAGSTDLRASVAAVRDGLDWTAGPATAARAFLDHLA